jgi:aquaporin related protein
MSANVESQVPESSAQSINSSKFITKLLPQKSFDKISIVLGEVLGTATLVFFGCASTVYWNGPPSGIGPMLTFGLTVMMVIQTFGHVSMALLNPAVTVCAVINKLLSVKVHTFATILSVHQKLRCRWHLC